MSEKFNHLTEEEVSEAYSLTKEQTAGPYVEKRVDFIARLIGQMRWVDTGSASATELSKIWRCSTRTINGWRDWAKRDLKKAQGDGADLRAILIENAKHIATSSMQAKKPFMNKGSGDVVYAHAPDHATALSAVDKIAELGGLKVKKHEHNHSHKYEAMSAGELVRELEAWREEKRLADGTAERRLAGAIDTEWQEQEEPEGVHVERSSRDQGD